MDIFVTQLTSYLLVFLVVIYYFRSKSKYTLPPGPRGLPFIGSIYLIIENPKIYFVFDKLAKKWGNLYTFNFGPFKSIIINDLKTTKEIFAFEAANGRPGNTGIYSRCEGGGNKGILLASGHTWSSQRRFTLKSLREFGFGRKTMNEIISPEVDEIVEKFDKILNIPIDISGRFNGAVLNAIWGLVSNERYDQDDPEMTKFFKNLASDGNMLGLFVFFPWIFHFHTLFGWLIPNPITSFVKNAKDGLNLMRSIMEKHKETYDENVIRDFIDMYLAEMKKATDSKSPFYQIEGEKNLITTMLDLFQASAETTSTTLTWAILLFAVNGNEQRKFYEEIKKVVGISNRVQLDHRKEMPYCEAYISEVLRFACLIPFTFRTLTDDIQYKDYVLPKGTTILVNIHSILNSTEAWTEPEKFNPDRFLTSEGTYKKCESFIPFSSGKRNCLGEQQALDQLFLFLTNIVQRYQILPDPSRPTPTKVEYKNGTIHVPVTFPIVLQYWKN